MQTLLIVVIDNCLQRCQDKIMFFQHQKLISDNVTHEDLNLALTAALVQSLQLCIFKQLY